MKFVISFLCTAVWMTGSTAWGQTYGCTDPLANNYDALADVDNGYCCYGNYLSIQASDNIANVEFSSLQSYYGMYWPYYNGDCFPDGCITAVAQRLDNEEAWVEVYNNGELVLTITTFEEFGGYYGFGAGTGNFTLGAVVPGCTNGYACNFNSLATCDDGSCDTSCAGCTDPSAANFDPDATINDGSCCAGANALSLTVNGNMADMSSLYFYGFGALYEFSPGSTTGCLPDGCWVVYLLFNGPNASDVYTLSDANGQILFSGSPTALQNGVPISINAVVACADYSACNYDPLSTCYDYSLCTYDCYGCTDPSAGNYDPSATIDNGTCCDDYYVLVADGPMTWNAWSPYNYSGDYGYFPQQDGVCLPSGCYNFATSSLYDPNTGITPNVTWQLLDANGNLILAGQTLDGLTQSFEIGEIQNGCNNPNACNYDPLANCGGDLYCTYDCNGCTDPIASNYSSNALFDNGSCCYNEWYTVSATVPGTWSVYSSVGGYYAYGTYPELQGFCSFDGCGVFSFYPNDFLIQDYSVTILNSNGEVVALLESSIDDYQEIILFEDNVVSGCGDVYACNYNSEVNCFDYSMCDYSCLGCTNAEAPNYDPNATIDNGSCCYGTWYTLEMSGPAYWSAYDNQTGAYYYGDYPGQNGFCLGTSCFQFQAWSYNGEDVTYSIFDAAGEIVLSNSFNYEGELVLVNPAQGLIGCGDIYACNYDPNVECSDYYSCDYSCYGCTNPSAPNYNPEATLDNGTCCLNNWLTVSFDEPCYWFAIGGDMSYSSGFYPEQNGFCSSSTCIGFYAYSLSGASLAYEILDQNGEIIFTGTSTGWGYTPGNFSLSDEVAGCTDPSACNYDESATCENGTCDYYCAGCTDLQAINYNSAVQYDDGSCVYEVEVPNMGMSIINDEENAQYYILLSMMDEGNGAPYVLSNSYNQELEMISESGQFLSGPYPCDVAVDMNLASMSAGLTTYYNASMEGACAQVSGISEPAVATAISGYPNPTSGLLQIVGLPVGQVQMTLRDLAGRTVWQHTANASMNGLELELQQAPGMYVLEADGQGQHFSLKVVIDK